MSPAARKLFLGIAILAVLGIAVSSVSLEHHFRKSKTTDCDFGQSFNCDIVNRSAYSSLFGIPVALIGMLGYAALAGLATVYRKRNDTPLMLLGGALGGLAFALYLTYIEGWVLGVWCILCLTSLVLISCISALSSLVWVRSRD